MLFTVSLLSLHFRFSTLQGVVRSVCFHPNAQLLLTAGLDKTLRFFNVDGKKNPKVQGLFLEDMPVYKAGFTGDGQKVVAAGRRKWFYVVDLASARVERVRVKTASPCLFSRTHEILRRKCEGDRCGESRLCLRGGLGVCACRAGCIVFVSLGMTMSTGVLVWSLMLNLRRY